VKLGPAHSRLVSLRVEYVKRGTYIRHLCIFSLFRPLYRYKAHGGDRKAARARHDEEHSRLVSLHVKYAERGEYDMRDIQKKKNDIYADLACSDPCTDTGHMARMEKRPARDLPREAQQTGELTR